MKNSITLTEASEHFSDCVERVGREKRPLIIISDGTAVGELVPPPANRTLRELAGILESLPRLSNGDAGEFAEDLAAINSAAGRHEVTVPWD